MQIQGLCMEVMSSSATSHLDPFKLPTAVDTLINILMSRPRRTKSLFGSSLLVRFPVTYVTNRVASAFRLPAESEYISTP